MMHSRARRVSLRLLPADEGYMPYLWLVYAAATFFYPAAVGSRSMFIETGAGAALFLVLYFRGYWLEGRALWPVVIGIAAIGAALGVVNPIASTYFVFAASFAAFMGSTALAWRVIVGLIVAILAESALLHLTPYFWVGGIVFVAIIGAATIRGAEMQRMNAQLRAAHDDVERLAKVAERERIARDVHDVLGHTLSVIVLKSELASRLAESDIARAVLEIREVERVARESLSELREALAGYRAAGIAAEIERARNVLRAAGVRFDCKVDAMQFPARTEDVLALAIREAITNVVRHAGASTCRLQIAVVPDGCRLEISDDGCGTREGEGLGLTGMRERVESLGGTFAREGANGTRLIVMLPIGAAQ
jgi:two-component system sensor histidine kinase DesK